MRYELTIELHSADEIEAVRVAETLASEHAAFVTVYRVTPGRTFADTDERELITTAEPAK